MPKTTKFVVSARRRPIPTCSTAQWLSECHLVVGLRAHALPLTFIIQQIIVNWVSNYPGPAPGTLKSLRPRRHWRLITSCLVHLMHTNRPPKPRPKPIQAHPRPISRRTGTRCRLRWRKMTDDAYNHCAVQQCVKCAAPSCSTSLRWVSQCSAEKLHMHLPVAKKNRSDHNEYMYHSHSQRLLHLLTPRHQTRVVQLNNAQITGWVSAWVEFNALPLDTFSEVVDRREGHGSQEWNQKLETTKQEAEFFMSPWRQWRWLHRAPGYVPPPTFTNSSARGHRQ